MLRCGCGWHGLGGGGEARLYLGFPLAPPRRQRARLTANDFVFGRRGEVTAAATDCRGPAGRFHFITPQQGQAMKYANARPHSTMLALSIRQPWAELILRGVKVEEFRSRRTNVRGRIFLYASLGRYNAADEAAWGVEHTIDINALPRGLIVGTVELYGCAGAYDDWLWRLRLPERLPVPRKPTRRPNPVWFYPW